MQINHLLKTNVYQTRLNPRFSGQQDTTVNITLLQKLLENHGKSAVTVVDPPGSQSKSMSFSVPNSGVLAPFIFIAGPITGPTKNGNYFVQYSNLRVDGESEPQTGRLFIDGQGQIAPFHPSTLNNQSKFAEAINSLLDQMDRALLS